MNPQPLRCSDLTFDMQGTGYGEPAYEADLGDLLWNPKAGDGHALVAEARCGIDKKGHGKYANTKADCGCGGWGTQPCPSTTLVCECGEDGSSRDHHYEILARVR